MNKQYHFNIFDEQFAPTMTRLYEKWNPIEHGPFRQYFCEKYKCRFERGDTLIIFESEHDATWFFIQ